MKEYLKEILPERIFKAIFDSDVIQGQLEEIRIRKNRQAYAISSGNNILIDIIAKDSEMQEILSIISNNSLYAHRDTLSKGYITVKSGIRIGIIGRASTEQGNVVGIYDISEFSIRIPNYITINISEIQEIVRKNSVLFYAPPGEGKTTLLRSIIKYIASGSGAKRIGVIDTRDELKFDLDDKELLVSILSGYPRKLGIEIAVRTINSQVIVCDEIGDESEAEAIIKAQGAGVPLIASCHGSSIKDIFSHSGIEKLHKAHIFDYYIGIRRSNNNFAYSIYKWEDANDFI